MDKLDAMISGQRDRLDEMIAGGQGDKLDAMIAGRPTPEPELRAASPYEDVRQQELDQPLEAPLWDKVMTGVAPFVAGMVAPALLPAATGTVGTLAAGAAGGALGGAAYRTTRNVVQERPLMSGTTPGSVGLDLAIGGAASAIPMAAGYVSKQWQLAHPSGAAPTGDLTISNAMRETPELGQTVGPFRPEDVAKQPMSKVQEAMLPFRQEFRILGQSADPEAQRLAAAGEGAMQNQRTLGGLGRFKLKQAAANADPEDLNWVGTLIEKKRQGSLAGIAVPKETAQRVQQTEGLLSEFDTAAKSIPDYMTRRDGELIPYEGIERGYFPRGRGDYQAPTSAEAVGGPTSGPFTMHSRESLTRATSVDYLADMDNYITHMSRELPLAKAFGKPTYRLQSEIYGKEPIMIGEKLGASIDDLMSRGLSHEAAAAKSFAERAYKVGKEPMEDNGATYIKRLASRLLLPRAFATNISQFAPAGWYYKMSDLYEGAEQVAKNPALASLPERSGATVPGVAEHLIQLGGEAANPAMSRLRTVEHMMRTVMSYGAIGRTYKLAQAVASGEPVTGAIERMADEAGLDLTALGQEYAQGGGVLSEQTLKNAVQQLSDKLEFQLGPGEIGRAFTHGPYSLITQYKGFSVKQTTLFKDAILSPIIEGMKTGDASLAMLGMKRAARFAVAQPATSALASAVKGAASGRLPSGAQVVGDMLSSGAGVAGDVPAAFIQGRGKEDTRNRLMNVVGSGVPALGPVSQALEIGLSGRPLDDAELALKFGVPLLAPRWALSAQAGANVLRDMQKPPR